MRIARVLASVALAATLIACAPNEAAPDISAASSVPAVTPSRAAPSSEVSAKASASGCPELPRTFEGDAGPSPLPDFPALDTLPKWNGDGMRFANEAICLLNDRMLGISKSERAALPKRVVGTLQDCPDKHIAMVGVGFCSSKNVFLVNAKELGESFARGGQTSVMIVVITTMTFDWGNREQIPGNPLGTERSHICARARMVGGLIKEGRIPASYEQIYGGNRNIEPYATASKTGDCR